MLLCLCMLFNMATSIVITCLVKTLTAGVCLLMFVKPSLTILDVNDTVKLFVSKETEVVLGLLRLT